MSTARSRSARAPAISPHRAIPSIPSVTMNGTTFRVADYKPIGRTDHAARRNADDAQRRWPATADAERRDHTGEADRRANGQIDPAADDDHRHSDCAERHDHRLRQTMRRLNDDRYRAGASDSSANTSMTSTRPSAGPAFAIKSRIGWLDAVGLRSSMSTMDA